MQWIQLLNPKRFREKVTVKEAETDSRSQFKRDFDAVCNSTIIRRLQDKAQVFPLEEGDFSRTRLTHSIEVMSVAETLGEYAVEVIKEKSKTIEGQKFLCGDHSTEKITDIIGDIPCIMKTIALLHDMGNPPFGHLGEQIICDWFEENLGKIYLHFDKTISNSSHNDTRDSLISKFNERKNEREHRDYEQDLYKYDGNAQLLRLITKLTYTVDEYGMNLTFPVIASLIKYPTYSSNIDEKVLSKKKMGILSSESDKYEQIKSELGLGDDNKNCRHPLTFLLEAADDISYLTADFEDAFIKKVVTFEEIKNCVKDNGSYTKHINNFMKNGEDQGLKGHRLERYVVHRLRVLIKGWLTNSVNIAFKDNYESIMRGEFEKELLEVCSDQNIVNNLRKLEKDNIYYSKEIIKNKIQASTVIKKLLDVYVPAAINWGESDKESDSENNLLWLSMSGTYRRFCQKETENNQFTSDRIYNKILLVLDQISGMTDTYALNEYKVITATYGK